MIKGLFKKGLFLLMILAVLCSCATAISFVDAKPKRESVLEFEHCWNNPFGTKETVADGELYPYTIKEKGCDDLNVKLFVYQTHYEAESYDVWTCEMVEVDLKAPNGSHYEKVCNSHEDQRVVKVERKIPYYLVENFTATDTICLEGSRKASTAPQACDMNFIYKDTDTKDFGLSWWNITWQVKYPVNTSPNNTASHRPMLINLFNGTDINTTDFQLDCGDLRVLDSAETSEFTFNLSVCNATQISFFVNESSREPVELWIYGNASSSVLSTSERIQELEFLNDLWYYFKADEDSGNLLDITNNITMTEVGTVLNQTGYVLNSSYDDVLGGSRGDYDTSDYFYRTGGDLTQKTFHAQSMAGWLYYDGTAIADNDNIDAWLDDVGSALRFYIGTDSKAHYQVSGSGGNADAEIGFIPGTGTWANFVGVFNGSQADIYMNTSGGTPDVVTGNSFNYTTHNIGVARFGGGPTVVQAAEGFWVDEWGGWNRSLSSDEVDRLHNSMGGGRGTSYPFYSIPIIVVGDRFENMSGSVNDSVGCNISLVTPCAGCRYPDNLLTVDYSCVNASNVTDCWYSINDFAEMHPVNCTAGMFNITAELGWNHFTLWLNSSSGNVTNSTLNFWAKKQDVQSWAEYVVIILGFAIALAALIVGAWTGLGIMYVVAGVGFSFMSLQLFAFSTWTGGFVLLIGVLVMLAGFVKPR